MMMTAVRLLPLPPPQQHQQPLLLPRVRAQRIHLHAAPATNRDRLATTVKHEQLVGFSRLTAGAALSPCPC
jgi:hypothetical protein